jgi:hypothetical protein
MKTTGAALANGKTPLFCPAETVQGFCPSSSFGLKLALVFQKPAIERNVVQYVRAELNNK